jgi:hypothetical protein
MKQNSRLLLLIGIVLLGLGAFMSLAGGPPKADPGQSILCQERMKGQGSEMLGRCDEAAFAAAMTATDANQAAASISASNNQEIGGNALAMFLLGIGLVVTLAGVLGWRKQARHGV